MKRIKALAAGRGMPQSIKNANQFSPSSKQFEPPKDPPISTTVTLEGMFDSLKMCRVEKGGYLANVPEEKVGHFYAGDSYVIFCKYEVSFCFRFSF